MPIRTLKVKRPPPDGLKILQGVVDLNGELRRDMGYISRKVFDLRDELLRRGHTVHTIPFPMKELLIKLSAIKYLNEAHSSER